MSYKCSVLTGDETGLLKYIRINESNNIITSYGEQSRSRGIIGLDWVERNKISAVLRKNGDFEIWNVYNESNDDDENDNEDKLALTKQIHLESLSQPVGCVTYRTNNSSSVSDKLIAYSNNGTSVIVDLLSLNLDHTMSLNGPISCGTVNSNSSSSKLFAYGGNENDLKIFDINSLKNRYKIFFNNINLFFFYNYFS